MVEYQKKRFKGLVSKTEAVKSYYEESIKELNYILDYLDKGILIEDSDNVDTIILKKYIEYGAMKDVCEFINDKGYRITTKYSNRKYTKEDISQIIYPFQRFEEEEPRVVEADEELKKVAKMIHLYIINGSYGRLKVKKFDK